MSILRLEVSNPDYSPANTQTITVHSSHLTRRHDITVYNAQSQAKNLAVVVLLHGVYGNHWVWMQMGGVHQVYERLRQQGLQEFVLVMPSDGGYMDGSAYLDLAEAGNYQQWIMEDVFAAVQQSVTAVSERSRWYISGLSMGGFGALLLGCQFSQRFSGISAHSSITNPSQLSQFVDYPLHCYPQLEKAEHLPQYWAVKGNIPPLRFDCGADDPLLLANIELHQILTQAGVDHEFEQLSGGHEWPYWHKNVEKSFRFFDVIERKYQAL
ncbi:alpha/beta hydrolase [Paraferrimonas haliotis]|uniref:Endo-1,4-beta-xylanase n=1 Tax=Paraferrimonas haliotis TaxID=2013866 RepID=A0AA37TVI5_9GAMM|nr:alpha/beta fold hydrolase [Paraferrimonas haliotis]GLS83709.1 endo-1,4-beta-xylanase [Paraferrimonas haliotis]